MKQTDDLVQAAQEEMLAHLGELASAQPALEGAGLAPGDRNTLQLTDVNRRQAVPRDPTPPELLQHVLATGFKLDTEIPCRNLLSSRRTARKLTVRDNDRTS